MIPTATYPEREERPAAREASTTELALRWREQRDQRAREELCARFLPLARRLAGRYRTGHEPIEDLVQVASLGLLGAIDRFDPARGVNFASFAVPTILGELRRYFRDTGWSAHVPRSAQELALRVDQARRDISCRTGRAPGIRELAEYLELNTEDVLVGLYAGPAHYATSLDAPVPGNEIDEPQSLGDTLGSEDDRFGLVEIKLSLRTAIPRLPYMERQALMLRIHGELTQIEIARELGCSQMQVSRLLRRATAKLRDHTDPDVVTQITGVASVPAGARG